MIPRLPPRAPRPLDPLDVNLCRRCTWPVVLLARVGWVHNVRSGIGVECPFPEPAYPSCTACGYKANTIDCRLVAHATPDGTRPCPGGYEPGIPPSGDDAAFAPVWPTSGPDVTR